MQHDVAKVGPDHEQVPDTPINPNNPDGPKWPSKYAYEKEVSFTVFYKSTDGNADLPDADVQKAYWVRTCKNNVVILFLDKLHIIIFFSK